MMHAFLLIGQSNMAGRGFLEEASYVDTSRIYVLRNGRWQKMFRPINPDRSFSGVNLAESFAERYAQEYDVDVGLICCADGGTRLEQWEPGSLLYDNAVSQTKLGQRNAVLSGILWHQGESDCIDLCKDEYRDKLKQMMDTLRSDLSSPTVPILLGGLGEYLGQCPRPDWNLHRYNIINEILEEMAGTVESIGYVSAAGLKPNPDYLHFNAKALYEFGLRYFDAYKEVTKDRVLVGDVKCSNEIIRSEMEAL